ncbi:MAG: HDOD domain-containing protein [Chloroherpetonaceae bacterium]
MSIIDKLLETQELATLPPVAAKVLFLIENENIDIREIARVVETDPTLTIKLLRVANSPLYATYTDITSVQQAIINLGLNRLTNIVLGVSIFSKLFMMKEKGSAELIEKFWWHSSCTAVVAKALAEKIHFLSKDYEFIGGLLHDIGKLTIFQYDTHLYSKVLSLVEFSNYTDLQAEQEIYGITHPEVGLALANLWKLPMELTNIIGFHHDIENLSNDEGSEELAIVRIADMLTEIWDAGFYEGLKSLSLKDTKEWKFLVEQKPELQDLDLEVFTFELEEEFKNSRIFLQLISE